MKHVDDVVCIRFVLGDKLSVMVQELILIRLHGILKMALVASPTDGAEGSLYRSFKNKAYTCGVQ